MSIFKKIFFVYLMFVAFFVFSNPNAKITNIDKEIEYLEEVKRGFESKAAQYEDMAQELQFKNNNLQDAKRYWRMADANKEAAKKIDRKIQNIKKGKSKLLKK